MAAGCHATSETRNSPEVISSVEPCASLAASGHDAGKIESLAGNRPVSSNREAAGELSTGQVSPAGRAERHRSSIRIDVYLPARDRTGLQQDGKIVRAGVRIARCACTTLAAMTG